MGLIIVILIALKASILVLYAYEVCMLCNMHPDLTLCMRSKLDATCPLLLEEIITAFKTSCFNTLFCLLDCCL